MGMLNSTQWTHVLPGASGSSAMSTKLRVPSGDGSSVAGRTVLALTGMLLRNRLALLNVPRSIQTPYLRSPLLSDLSHENLQHEIARLVELQPGPFRVHLGPHRRSAASRSAWALGLNLGNARAAATMIRAVIIASSKRASMNSRRCPLLAGPPALQHDATAFCPSAATLSTGKTNVSSLRNSGSARMAAATCNVHAWLHFDIRYRCLVPSAATCSVQSASFTP